MRGTFISGGGARAGLLLRAMMLSSALGGAAMLPVHAQAQTAERQFDIPAQSLGDALMAFGRQSGMQVTAEGPLIEGRNSSAVSGRMATGQALSQLLAGSGLTFRYVGSNAVRLERAPQAADGAVQLGPVRVEGAGSGRETGIAYSITSDPSATERTGSYTTHSMASATKLPLSIRETPQSVTVLTRQKMDDLAVKNLDDVVVNTPGLTLKKDGSYRPRIFSRGFQIENILYDGIPSYFYGDNLTSNMAIYDRVEIVRGSAGLMQGAGTPSASINLVRKRPTTDRQILANASVGSWSDYHAELDASTPLTGDGKVRGRVVATYENSKEFIDRIHRDHRLIYGIIDADLAEGFNIAIGAFHQNEKNDGDAWGSLPFNLDGSDLHLPRSTNLSYDWTFYNKKETQAFLDFTKELGGDWKVKGSAVWSKANAPYLAATIPYTYDDTHQLHDYEYRLERKSLDLFASGSVQLFGRTHELVVGASHSTARGRTKGYTANIPLTSSIFDWNPHRPLPQEGDADFQLAYPMLVNTYREQSSAYGTARLSLADGVKFILGSRLDFYKLDQDMTYEPEYGTTYVSYKKNGNLTKYAGLVVDLDKHHSVYGSYTDIFLPQNYNGRNGELLDPVVGQNYEVGLKGEYREGRLNWSLALFQIDQSNRPYVLPSTECLGGSTCYAASGLVRSKGVDVEVNGELAPGWQISAGYVFNEAKYRKDATASKIGQLFDTGLPRHQAKLSTTYQLTGALDGLRIGGSMVWQNTVFYKGTSEGVNWLIQQKAYAVANLFSSYRFSDHATVNLNLDNILDKRYYSDITRYPSNSNSRYGEPRSFRLEFRYSY